MGKMNKDCEFVLLQIIEYYAILLCIILYHYLNWIDYVEREVDDEWIWPRIRDMLRKCQPFIKFNETKCKEILKNRVASVIQKT